MFRINHYHVCAQTLSSLSQYVWWGPPFLLFVVSWDYVLWESVISEEWNSSETAPLGFWRMAEGLYLQRLLVIWLICHDCLSLMRPSTSSRDHLWGFDLTSSTTVCCKWACWTWWVWINSSRHVSDLELLAIRYEMCYLHWYMWITAIKS